MRWEVALVLKGSTTWQVSLVSCILLSRIPTLVVHMHATKACRGNGGTAPHILKVGTRGMRVLSLALQETPPQPVRRLEDLFPVTEFEP